MRVLSWNVNGTFPPNGSTDAIDEQVDWLDSLDPHPDILLLQEVNPNQRGYWYDVLGDSLGYQAITDTLDMGQKLDNSNGHITATRNGWSLSGNKFNPEPGDGTRDLQTAFPEKILLTELDTGQTTIDFWNVRAVPGRDYPEEKVIILELVYERIEAEGAKARILAGDLNTPRRELPDGQPVTYGYDRESGLQQRAIAAELSILRGLGHFGMIDVFRAQHGYGQVEVRDTSHDGRRIDQLFASEALNPIDCWYAGEGLTYSDHAPVIGEFAL